MQHPWQDEQIDTTLSDANTKAADGEISSLHGRSKFSVFRHIPCIVSNFLNPDHLHPMQISILEQLQMWILHYRKMYKWLDQYDAMWLLVPASTTSH
jgi:hypothetical protein